MSVCESCGVTFDPKKLPTTLTTTRVLCPTCYERRQAEKAASKAKAATGTSTVVMAAPRPPPPAPGPKPAPAPSPEPAAAHHAPAKSSRSRHGPKKEEVDKKAALSSTDAPVLDKTTRIGLILAAVTVGIACIAFFVVKGQKADERLQEEELLKTKEHFITQVRAYPADTVEGASQLIAYASAKKELWTDTDISSEVTSKVIAARAFLQSNTDKTAYLGRLAELEATISDASGKSAKELRDFVRTADGLALNAQGYGPEAITRVTGAKKRLQEMIGTKLKEEAVAFADEKGVAEPMAAMLKLGTAEDEVRRLWETAVKEKDKSSQRLFESFLSELIAKTDGLATDYFSANEGKRIEEVPWKDLLVGDATTGWRGAAVKGFEWKVTGGALQLRGPDDEARGSGIVSIGQKEQWRDFVLEGQFTIEKGAITLAFRLGNSAPNQNTDTIQLECAEGEPIQAGGTYSFTYSMIGSTAKVTWKDEIYPPSERQLYWTNNRHGEFGIVVSKGTKLRFERLRIRELR